MWGAFDRLMIIRRAAPSGRGCALRPSWCNKGKGAPTILRGTQFGEPQYGASLFQRNDAFQERACVGKEVDEVVSRYLI